MRYIPFSNSKYEEWGNPNEKDFFDYILSYSPYENIPRNLKVLNDVYNL